MKYKVLGTKQDLVSAGIHMLGMALSIAALVVLVVIAARKNEWRMVVGFAVYGAGLILLYGSSSVYHFIYVSPRVHDALRKVDHMMIFVLIAATYTPICMIPLRGWWGYGMLTGVWSIAIAGILVKLFWMNAPRWLSTGLYIFMGWLAMIAVVPLSRVLSPNGMFLLALGGVIYTVGGVLYAIKKPSFTNEWFSFHELWHIFVLFGSISHFLMMLTLV